MAIRDKIEVVKGTSVTEESTVLACNYSNALHAFKGTSIIISDLYEHSEYRKFIKLRNQWHSETRFVSSSTQIFNNAAYNKIIAFGLRSIPWIIRDMKKSDSHWFDALTKITGQDPISPEHYGVIPRMKEDWIHWAQKHNYEFD